ncbi:unnamed protein product [Caenorhabditis auriculariae]|uniref:RecQ-mediated genome instability protein 1 n=1 Tax=Caenorhabditis auriculariae TaxID=2777116 RepID=A0A8S1GPR6_9PELO|nr:unnamed protein product [Caenorhabditis auriculariae]
MDDETLFQTLSAHHFHCKRDWFDSCLQFLRSQLPPKEIEKNLFQCVVEQFCNSDLKESYVAPMKIPTNASKAILQRKIVFQVLKYVDVSRSFYEQLTELTRAGPDLSWFTGETAEQSIEEPKKGSQKRFLKLEITDGLNNLMALDLDGTVFTETKIAPGTKFMLTDSAKCRRGMIFLSNSNCQILGGQVDSLAYDPVENFTKSLKIDLNSEEKRKEILQKQFVLDKQQAAVKKSCTQSSISPFLVRKKREEGSSNSDLNETGLTTASTAVNLDKSLEKRPVFSSTSFPNKVVSLVRPHVSVPAKEKILPPELIDDKFEHHYEPSGKGVPNFVKPMPPVVTDYGLKPKNLAPPPTIYEPPFEKVRVKEEVPFQNSFLTEDDMKRSLASVKTLNRSAEEQKRSFEKFSSDIHGPRGSPKKWRKIKVPEINTPITNYFNVVKNCPKLASKLQNVDEDCQILENSGHDRKVNPNKSTSALKYPAAGQNSLQDDTFMNDPCNQSQMLQNSQNSTLAQNGFQSAKQYQQRVEEDSFMIDPQTFSQPKKQHVRETPNRQSNSYPIFNGILLPSRKNFPGFVPEPEILSPAQWNTNGSYRMIPHGTDSPVVVYETKERTADAEQRLRAVRPQGVEKPRSTPFFDANVIRQLQAAKQEPHQNGRQENPARKTPVEQDQQHVREVQQDRRREDSRIAMKISINVKVKKNSNDSITKLKLAKMNHTSVKFGKLSTERINKDHMNLRMILMISTCVKFKMINNINSSSWKFVGVWLKELLIDRTQNNMIFFTNLRFVKKTYISVKFEKSSKDKIIIITCVNPKKIKSINSSSGKFDVDLHYGQHQLEQDQQLQESRRRLAPEVVYQQDQHSQRHLLKNQKHHSDKCQRQAHEDQQRQQTEQQKQFLEAHRRLAQGDHHHELPEPSSRRKDQHQRQEQAEKPFGSFVGVPGRPLLRNEPERRHEPQSFGKTKPKQEFSFESQQGTQTPLNLDSDEIPRNPEKSQGKHSKPQTVIYRPLYSPEKTPTKRATQKDFSNILALKRPKKSPPEDDGYRDDVQKMYNSGVPHEVRPPPMYRISSREDPTKNCSEIMSRFRRIGVVYLSDALHNRKFWMLPKRVTIMPTHTQLVQELSVEGNEWKQQLIVNDVSMSGELCEVSSRLLDRLFGFTVAHCQRIGNLKRIDELKRCKDHAAQVLKGFCRLDLVIFLDVAPHVDKLPVVVDVKTLADALNIL